LIESSPSTSPDFRARFVAATNPLDKSNAEKARVGRVIFIFVFGCLSCIGCRERICVVGVESSFMTTMKDHNLMRLLSLSLLSDVDIGGTYQKWQTERKWIYSNLRIFGLTE
jgi:hypothetical protein